jgi:hypothetical protein
MIFKNTSEKLRIFWALFLSLALSGSALAEVFCLTERDKETSELNLIDEESKVESEKSEEGNSRKHNENSFEFSGAEGEFETSSQDFICIRQYAVLLYCNCSYLYYPHINSATLAVFRQAQYERASLLVLYHKFVFYDLIQTLS